MLRLLDLLTIDFGQAIHIVVVALDAKVLCKVNDFHVCRDGVLFDESLAFAVSEAEEQHIDLIERHLGSELQVTIPVESFVHVGD